MHRQLSVVRSGLHRKYGLSIFLLVVLTASLLTGCATSKKEMQGLVKAGSTTSEQLAQYYDALIQKHTDYITIISYNKGIPFSPTEKKDLLKERKAYASRAELARKLKAAYDALGLLVDYDASAEVGGAIGELLSTVLKQVPHPDQLDSDLFKTVVNKVAGKLVEIQQEKQFRKNAPRVMEVLDGIAEIFEMERDVVYVDTARLYEDQAAKLARRMIGTEDPGTDQGTGMGMMQKFVEPYGLKLYLTTVTDHATRVKNQKFFMDKIDEDSKNFKVAEINKARNMSTALYNLVRVHRKFLGTKPTAPLLTEADVQETSKLANTLSQALAARELWEKQQADLKKSDEDYKIKPYEPPADGLVSDYVATMLSPAVKEMLKAGGNQTSSGNFRRLLIEDLNRIIETDNIYESILSEKGREDWDKVRIFIIEEDGTLDQLRLLRNGVLNEVNQKLEAEHRKYTGGGGGSLPAAAKLLMRRDAAGKALARLNRAILAFVYQGSLTPSA